MDCAVWIASLNISGDEKAAAGVGTVCGCGAGDTEGAAEQRAAAGRNIGKRSRIILLSTTAKDRLRIGSQPPKMYLA
jgi:hypothetical protein